MDLWDRDAIDLMGDRHGSSPSSAMNVRALLTARTLGCSRRIHSWNSPISLRGTTEELAW